jgi:hypothetical protein
MASSGPTKEVWVKLQRGLADEIESYAEARGLAASEAMLELWRFALSVRLHQHLGEEGNDLLKRLGLPRPEELPPLQPPPVTLYSKKEHRCRVCGSLVPQGYHFCPPEQGRTFCYYEYNNNLSRKLCTVRLQVPRPIWEGIKEYARLEGFALGLPALGLPPPAAYEIAMRDLWKFALEIRLPQLGLKTLSRKFQPARYTIEERLAWQTSRRQLPDS